MNIVKNIILYPIDNGLNYWYLEGPYNPNNCLNVKECLEKYRTYIDLELPINRNETIYSKLKIPIKDNKIMYTFQYFDSLKNIKIRTDRGMGKHTYPHIDIETKNLKLKNLYDTDPADYEASINTILRYAERISNKFIGFHYWLYSLMTYNDTLIYSYLKIFEEYFKNFNLNVSLTDIARLTSIELYKIGQENKILNDEDISRLIVQQFMKALKYEQEFKRPLKMSRNVLAKNINILPFPVILLDKPISLIVDNLGNIVDNKGWKPTGIVTYKNDKNKL
jgi:hypothetical protein